MAKLSCTFPDCSNSNFARGYCAGHAAQIRKGQELKPLRQRVEEDVTLT